MHIVTLGEILIDMFPAEVGRPLPQVSAFHPKPGGAPANVAVAAMLYACVRLQSRALLLTTVLAMLGFIGYLTAEHFVDSLGWPISLILMGVAFIGVATLAMRIKRQI